MAGRNEHEVQDWLDAEVFRYLREGSHDAFRSIYKQYSPKIYNVALRWLKVPVEAEEIVQEVFLTLWLKRHELGYIEKFEAYLKQMARYSAHLAFKRLVAKQARETEYAATRSQVDETTDHPLQENHNKELLQQAITRLSPQQRQVFLLSREENLTHKEIADKLNIKKATASRHINDALEKIREYINPHFSVFLVLGLGMDNLIRLL